MFNEDSDIHHREIKLVISRENCAQRQATDGLIVCSAHLAFK